MNLLQTRNGSNVVQAQYTWGAGMGGGIGGLLARTVGTPAHHYYYHYDGGGNVVALTNASQQTVARYQYGAYGNLVASGLVTGDATLTDTTDQAQQNANPFRFSTKWLHSQSGLYDYGFRFYSPGLGRFINRDPIREDGGMNLYGFVGNNPVNRIDPYGLYIGDWIDEHILMGSVSDFGDAYGWYDNGCGSGWRVAGLGFVAGGKTVALAFVAAAGGATGAAAAGDAVAGLGVAGVGASGAAITGGGGQNLYRIGVEPETAENLAEQAAKAAANGFPHGVSVLSRAPSRPDVVFAPRAAVEQAFNVIKTGQNPHHYTVELPDPVTPEVADQFNSVFGRH